VDDRLLSDQFADTNFSQDEKQATSSTQPSTPTAYAMTLQGQDHAEEDVGRFDPYLLAQLSKLHVELDRNEAAREKGYDVGLFKMYNSEFMAKGELLVGIPDERSVWHPISALLSKC
jgi:hypothetical protein